VTSGDARAKREASRENLLAGEAAPPGTRTFEQEKRDETVSPRRWHH
jgi:hypothetical protein